MQTFNIFLVNFNRQLLCVDRIHCMSSGFSTGNTSRVANMEKIFLSLGVV